MHFMDLMILLLYLCILVSSIHNIFLLKDSMRSREEKLLIAVFNIALVIQSSSFLYLQSDWIFNGYDEVISDSSAMWWKVYDWSNGAALFAFSRILGVFSSWKEK